MSTFNIGQHVRILGGAFASYEGAVVAVTPETVTVAVMMFGRLGRVQLPVEDVDPTLHARKVAEQAVAERSRSQEQRMQEAYALARKAGDDRESALERVADEFGVWVVTSRDSNGCADEVCVPEWLALVCRD